MPSLSSGFNLSLSLTLNCNPYFGWLAISPYIIYLSFSFKSAKKPVKVNILFIYSFKSIILVSVTFKRPII